MALRYPVDNVKISQGFGSDPSFYKQYGQLGHNGLDIAVPAGTPVYAADDGVVQFEGWGQNSSWMGSIAGICAIIKHRGCQTGYAHLASTVVSKGQTVSKGQVIGYSGATGVVSGPHLHFEVFPLNPNFNNGFAGRIDPMPYINTSKTATADQIKQAYRDILERDADAGGLKHYQAYTIEFVRQDLARSQEKRALDAAKAEAVRVAAERAQEEAARKAEEAKKAADAKKALEAAEKAAREQAAAEAELARIAEEERIARERAEAKAREQAEIAQEAKEVHMATTAEQIKEIGATAQKVLDSNDFTPPISDKTKTIAYFATDIAIIVSSLVFTILAILAYVDAVVAITINTAIGTAMLGIKQTFRLSSKKQ